MKKPGDLKAITHPEATEQSPREMQVKDGIAKIRNTLRESKVQCMFINKYINIMLPNFPKHLLSKLQTFQKVAAISNIPTDKSDKFILSTHAF